MQKLYDKDNDVAKSGTLSHYYFYNKRLLLEITSLQHKLYTRISNDSLFKLRLALHLVFPVSIWTFEFNIHLIMVFLIHYHNITPALSIAQWVAINGGRTA